MALEEPYGVKQFVDQPSSAQKHDHDQDAATNPLPAAAFFVGIIGDLVRAAQREIVAESRAEMLVFPVVE